PHGFRFELLPSDHGQYFSDETLRIFAPKLREVFDWAEGSVAGAPAPDSNGVVGPMRTLPSHGYRARISTSAITSMRPTERRTISVEGTNAGSVSWPGGAEGAIALGNHWLSGDYEMLVWADG